MGLTTDVDVDDDDATMVWKAGRTPRNFQTLGD